MLETFDDVFPDSAPTLPIVLGGNVFGWTADKEQSFAVLDAFLEAGGSMIDTADSYSHWVDGKSGGDSEQIIGEWMASRGVRDRMLIATKVGSYPGLKGLAAATIAKAADASLQRLGTDHIDLYYAHRDDPDTPLDETLGAFGDLVRDGKVRAVGASNYSGVRLTEALELAGDGRAPYVALQPEYNLVSRDYEHDQAPVLAERGLRSFPYYGLASGFLTGKYRPGTSVDSARAGRAAELAESDRGQRVLAALDSVADETGAHLASVALAWLLAQPTVAAPIASARTPEQLAPLVAAAGLELSDEQLRRLTDAA